MIFDSDSYLMPFKRVITDRYQMLINKRQDLMGKDGKISSNINNHLYYMLHKEGKEWVFREWAPNATAIYLIGELNSWQKDEKYAFSKLSDGNWELRVPEKELKHEMLYRYIVEWSDGSGERLPSYATRCVQDEETKLFSAQVWAPAKKYKWKKKYTRDFKNPLIYEVHIGMGVEEEKVGTFNEFRENVLPYIAELGYNTIQIMALHEHPYYGSFGYQVANFFAVSSRFGTPDEFKQLVDEAHGYGIAVIMDVVHSHAVSNEIEGLGKFDGTEDLYFHAGDRGKHPAWNSRCFDYGKSAVVHFLLSNLKFWMEEYHLDGFRFDGVTSMLYYDHGLGRDFCSYDAYYDGGQDVDALVYLGLANIMVKEINGDAFTIAEEMSGMPGLAAPISQCGWGFDFRMSMGVPDNWIKWIKDVREEDWSMGGMYYELTNKRKDEKTISYVECHDQAMVGDKTVIFRLIDKEMYFSMDKASHHPLVERGLALHKMIRLVTVATAGDGYLTFMGNEFGHPEWIDFPREGNNWSHKHARRQWSLKDDPDLHYKALVDFDRDMIHVIREGKVLRQTPMQLYVSDSQKVLIFVRGRFIFALNFNSVHSFTDFEFCAPSGEYRVALSSDARIYDGFGRIDDSVHHHTIRKDGGDKLSLYLPSRSAIVLEKIR